ncbi:sulfurtransferase TusA family protein [Halonatronum saccharophilum]|uniref:sulfurtransferase TusA family protein n=1 Tax=Halonatronum saccharophilum TaxID=150060 RepID=UPI00048056CB|nr:sulfurtransferase TusA family protein [Halonatronum saccharophilum]
MSNEPQFIIPKEVKEDTKNYRSLVRDFVEGRLDEARFKGRRVPMGIYGQRSSKDESDKYMVRVRIPGGVMSREQFAKLNQLSKEYGSAYLHFTTRQDIQIHQVNIEDTPDILEELLAYGLSPRGGGGNTVRNIMNSSLAGVDPEEVFDTTPHNLALTQYLIKTRSSFNLPRKYKISFSSSAKDDALATINDLGFIAKKSEGKRGFKVYGGGGMGGSPELSIVLEEFIEEDKIFYVAEAIKRLFDDYGDRSNKHQARLRFVKKRLGDEGFIAKYKEYLAEVLEEDLLVEDIISYQELRSKGEVKGFDVDYIHPEKEKGYYSLELRPENGDVYYSEVKELLKLLTSDEISLRTTNKQGLLIRGVKGQQLEALVSAIKEINSELLVANVGTTPIACKGASTCRLGLCLSPNLAQEIKEVLEELDAKLQGLLPQIYISGCPNACGQHFIGNIGFAGKAKRYNDKLVPHYSLLLGGNIGEGQSRYGEEVIDIPTKRIPQFLVSLVKKLKEEGVSRANFNAYLEKGGKEKIIDLAKEFIQVPSYKEDSDIYKDWGKEEDFSLAGRGPGECGAGVMDIIQLDINMAKEGYNKGINEEDSSGLYKAIINAARALLIVKGIDTDKDRVIIKSFKSEFLDGDLVDKNYEDLLDKAIDYRLGDIDDLLDTKDDIKNLIGRVEKLFNSLNAKLEFQLEDLDTKEQDDNSSNGEEKEEGKNLSDLRGVKCPMNFVKAKVAIAPLNKGDILEIYLDEGAPIANVPRSLASEGHKILAKEKIGEGYYLLKVKKG